MYGKFNTRLDALWYSYISHFFFVNPFPSTKRFQFINVYENYLTSNFHTNTVISRRVCLLFKMASKTVIRPIYSLSHPGVLTFHICACKLAYEFKSSTSRYANVLFPQVVQNPIVQKSLKPILWSWKHPSSSMLANYESKLQTKNCKLW